MVPPYNRPVFAEVIEKARHNVGLTQRELGVRLGLAQQAVQKWEKGKSRPSPETVGRLSVELGIDETDLLKLTGYMTPYVKEANWRGVQRLSDGRIIELKVSRGPADVAPLTSEEEPARVSVVDAINADPELDDDGRTQMYEAYRVMVQLVAARRAAQAADDVADAAPASRSTVRELETSPPTKRTRSKR